MYPSKIVAVVLTLLAVPLAGCASNRYVGTWSGTVQAVKNNSGGILGDLAGLLAQGAMGGQATVTLKLGGTGYLKVGSMPERPITWKADGDKLILTGVTGRGGDAEKTADGKSDEIVGTLSSDGQSLTLDFGPVNVPLKKQGGA